MAEESKRHKFERLLYNRTSNVFKELHKIRKMGKNPTLYQFNQKDVDELHKALSNEVEDVIKTFNEALEKGGKGDDVPDFKLSTFKELDVEKEKEKRLKQQQQQRQAQNKNKDVNSSVGS